MKAAIKLFVQSCAICQLSKYYCSRALGLLQPLPVLDLAWQVISLDFVEGLPLSDTYNYVLVVVDLLTKCGHPFIAIGMAKAFFHSIYRLHGLPTAIVSDPYCIVRSKWLEGGEGE
jgi:hypothetical protein